MKKHTNHAETNIDHIMESTVKRKFFSGAGILAGFALGISAFLLITAFTGNVKTAIPLGIAISSSLGPVFEQYLSDRGKPVSKGRKKLGLLLISAGGILFVLWYFATATDS